MKTVTIETLSISTENNMTRIYFAAAKSFFATKQKNEKDSPTEKK